tara:strand:- start:26586 stop:26966 length:381 start_codon:yes stop_codon:yes gene_type:complete
MTNKLLIYLKDRIADLESKPVKKPFLYGVLYWMLMSDYFDWMLSDSQHRAVYAYGGYVNELRKWKNLQSYLVRNNIDENNINDHLSATYGYSQNYVMGDAWLPSIPLYDFQILMEKVGVRETWTVS